jgi:hypothetical protein
MASPQAAARRVAAPTKVRLPGHCPPNWAKNANKISGQRSRSHAFAVSGVCRDDPPAEIKIITRKEQPGVFLDVGSLAAAGYGCDTEFANHRERKRKNAGFPFESGHN